MPLVKIPAEGTCMDSMRCINCFSWLTSPPGAYYWLSRLLYLHGRCPQRDSERPETRYERPRMSCSSDFGSFLPEALGLPPACASSTSSSRIAHDKHTWKRITGPHALAGCHRASPVTLYISTQNSLQLAYQTELCCPIQGFHWAVML